MVPLDDEDEECVPSPQSIPPPQNTDKVLVDEDGEPIALRFNDRNYRVEKTLARRLRNGEDPTSLMATRHTQSSPQFAQGDRYQAQMAYQTHETQTGYQFYDGQNGYQPPRVGWYSATRPPSPGMVWFNIILIAISCVAMGCLMTAAYLHREPLTREILERAGVLEKIRMLNAGTGGGDYPLHTATTYQRRLVPIYKGSPDTKTLLALFRHLVDGNLTIACLHHLQNHPSDSRLCAMLRSTGGGQFFMIANPEIKGYSANRTTDVLVKEHSVMCPSPRRSQRHAVIDAAFDGGIVMVSTMDHGEESRNLIRLRMLFDDEKEAVALQRVVEEMDNRYACT